jgi:hypothetical protein
MQNNIPGTVKRRVDHIVFLKGGTAVNSKIGTKTDSER